jgi:hypothetical protein
VTDYAHNITELSDIKLTLKQYYLLLKIIGQCKNCTNKFNSQLTNGGGLDHQKETETTHQTTKALQTKVDGNY